MLINNGGSGTILDALSTKSLLIVFAVPVLLFAGADEVPADESVTAALPASKSMIFDVATVILLGEKWNREKRGLQNWTMTAHSDQALTTA